MNKMLFLSAAMIATALHGAVREGGSPEMFNVSFFALCDELSSNNATPSEEIGRARLSELRLRTPEEVGSQNGCSPERRSSTCRERTSEEYEALKKALNDQDQQKNFVQGERTYNNIVRGELVGVEALIRSMIHDKSNKIFKIFAEKLKLEKENDEACTAARLNLVLELQKIYGSKISLTLICPYTHEIFNTQTGHTIK